MPRIEKDRSPVETQRHSKFKDSGISLTIEPERLIWPFDGIPYVSMPYIGLSVMRGRGLPPRFARGFVALLSKE